MDPANVEEAATWGTTNGTALIRFLVNRHPHCKRVKGRRCASGSSTVLGVEGAVALARFARLMAASSVRKNGGIGMLSQSIMIHSLFFLISRIWIYELGESNQIGQSVNPRN